MISGMDRGMHATTWESRDAQHAHRGSSLY